MHLTTAVLVVWLVAAPTTAFADPVKTPNNG